MCYGRSLATGKLIELGEAVGVIAAQSIGEPGTQLTMRTFHTGGVAGKDIAGGLPRVVELFEARTPRGAARLAKATGVLRLGEDVGKGIPVTVVGDEGEEHEIALPLGARPIVSDGQDIKAGDPITDGPFDPKELMEIKGIRETQMYLVEEVQQVYRDQGVSISDKHIELIVRQMTRRVGVQEPATPTSCRASGSTPRSSATRTGAWSRRASAPPRAGPRSWASPRPRSPPSRGCRLPSFQETTRVLTEAAIDGRGDSLIGLKENIIIGKLIPAGTGMDAISRVRHRGSRLRADDVLLAATPRRGPRRLAVQHPRLVRRRDRDCQRRVIIGGTPPRPTTTCSEPAEKSAGSFAPCVGWVKRRHCWSDGASRSIA